jgi:hypothetical protein
MRKIYLVARLALPLLLAGSILAGCAAGVNPRLMQTDAEIVYGQKQQKLIIDKRLEFDQLADDFLLTRKPVFLDKMAGALVLTEKEVDKAQAFLDLQPPYHRGIALARRKVAYDAVRTGEKQLCEMLLVFGELHMQYGDPTTARTALEKLKIRFAAESFTGYRQKASALLEEAGGAGETPCPEQT